MSARLPLEADDLGLVVMELSKHCGLIRSLLGVFDLTVISDVVGLTSQERLLEFFCVYF